MKYSFLPTTKLSGFDPSELLNHVWPKNSLQWITLAFYVNEKPTHTIYGS